MRAGLLPRLLSEILDTRVMVKAALKKAQGRPDCRVLARCLNARQFGLKMIANVTYGYTSAGFSGRMPCAEIADAIVSSGRDTLERAIRLVESNPEWRAEARAAALAEATHPRHPGTAPPRALSSLALAAVLVSDSRSSSKRVFDFERLCSRMLPGPSCPQVKYGDTDSLFVHLPGRSRAEAFRIGNEIAAAVTAQNPRPVKLQFEKVREGAAAALPILSLSAPVAVRGIALACGASALCIFALCGLCAPFSE